MFLAILAFVAAVTAPPSPPPLVTPAPSPSPLVAPSSAASPVPQPSPTPSTAPFTVVPATLALSPAQQRVLQVNGASAPVRVTSDRGLLRTQIDQVKQTITVTATQATGLDTLHLIDARGATVDVPVRVAFAAGTVPATATLQVTGSPVDPDWLVQAVENFVAHETRAQPGAPVTLTPVTPPPTPLVAGAQAVFSVPVHIAGGDAFFDVDQIATVHVQNVAVDPFLPPLLLYDDDPEHVTADGVLFRGTVESSRPVRLYYYHDDGAQPRRVVVMLSSRANDSSSVQVIDSTAGPNLDVMSVGHAATKNFLVAKPLNEGTIVTVDGGDFAVLHDLPMQYRQGVAGTIDLRVLSGGPVVVTVVAASPGVDPGTLLDGPIVPGDGHHRRGVFVLTNYATAQLPYVVGGPETKLVYGDRSQTPMSAAPDATGHDYGDYGVLWNLDFTLTNPTPVPATVYLYERPLGGVVRSSFVVANKLVDMGCARLPTPYEIGAYELAPGQTYGLPVQTMTDGGSNYPLEVGLTATPPQPTPPPISSPQGCFPKP